MYLLGSLLPAVKQEYEEHYVGCRRYLGEACRVITSSEWRFGRAAVRDHSADRCYSWALSSVLHFHEKPVSVSSSTAESKPLVVQVFRRLLLLESG